MIRYALLGAVSAAALVYTPAALATSTLTGGGATSPEYDYFAEFALYNSQQGSGAVIFSNPGAPTADDALFWPSGSGAGQTAFLNNDLTCDSNKVLKINSGNCSGVEQETIYGASDGPFSSAQISSWANAPYGQAVSGNLIQIPAQGTGPAIVTVNPGVTSNAQVTLSDNDLCGIFSGKITNWSTIAAESKNKGKGIQPGTIQVVYRADSGAAVSFLLTDHLSHVCNSSNSNITFSATQNFISLFSTKPANFYGETSSGYVANYISGYGSENGNPTFSGYAIAYVSPDYTTVDPKSNAYLQNPTGSSNNVKSTLVAAQLQNGSKYYLPTTANISTGLLHIGTLNPASPTSPPTTAAEAAQTYAFVPIIETTTQGYPIVGYGTFDLAQCYKDPAVTAALLAFLNDHYYNASYQAILANNGLVGVSNSGAVRYLNAVKTFIFPGKGKTAKDYGTELGSKSGCAGKAGR